MAWRRKQQHKAKSIRRNENKRRQSSSMKTANGKMAAAWHGGGVSMAWHGGA
jgi:hypothetical protein